MDLTTYNNTVELYNKTLGPLFLPAFEQAGLWLGDKFRYINLKNINRKFEQIRSLDADFDRLKLKHLLLISEKASLEDDNIIQSMWAGLLANAVDPNKKLKMNRVYINILSSLEPLDVKVLNCLASKTMFDSKCNINSLSKEINESINDVFMSIQNLYALGCVVLTVVSAKGRHAHGGGDDGTRHDQTVDIGMINLDGAISFNISHLARNLIKACK